MLSRVWRLTRVLVFVVLGGSMVTPAHPGAAAATATPRHLVIRGHNTYTFGIDYFTIGDPTVPQAEVQPFTILHGPAVDPAAETVDVTFPYGCQASISDDSGGTDDFTIELRLYDPSGAQISPVFSQWHGSVPSFTAGNIWQLTNPVEGTYSCKAHFWVYTYDLGWSSPYTASLSYVMPTGETTAAGSWLSSGNQTIHSFNVSINGPVGANFNGRTVSEADAGGAGDNCYYPTSPIPQYTGIRALSAPVGSSNSYADQVGWDEFAVAVYRGAFGYNRVAPCGFWANQNMYINKPGSPDQWYKANALLYQIWLTSVTATRDGVPANRPW